ncbi:MAG: PKD domain-containing protein [Euryarchaeota archaeon]|nr:PKD domain-containing protein [Euryarchaeota archaeon]
MVGRNKDKRLLPLVAVAIFTMAALSGCLGEDDADSIESTAPRAVLEVDRESRFAGEPFTFDAQSSSDPNGNITKWVFDFGDGETFETEDVDEARVKHRYDAGGVYSVTLTVFDDATDQEGPLNTTTERTVIVDRRIDIGPAMVAAAPTNSSATARSERAFEANETAERYELDLLVENAMALGDSKMTVRVVDDNGTVLFEELVEVGQGENVTVESAEALTGEGTFVLELIAESGASRATGELRIYHGTGSE